MPSRISASPVRAIETEEVRFVHRGNSQLYAFVDMAPRNAIPTSLAQAGIFTEMLF